MRHGSRKGGKKRQGCIAIERRGRIFGMNRGTLSKRRETKRSGEKDRNRKY